MNEPLNTSTPQPDDEHAGGFQLDHGLYAIAVFISTVTMFGVSGILPGLLIPWAWACVFYSRSRPMGLAVVCCVIILCVCIAPMMLPVSGGSGIGEAGRLSNCKSKLKQIAIALHNYHDFYGSFPPAYIADENARPMHSWRVLILPQLDDDRLYREYDFNEPWDGPNNSKLSSRMPDVYACLSSASHRNGRGDTTSYVAVIGPHTSWPGSVSRKFTDFTDGTSNTVLVVESNPSGVPWMSPHDLTLNDALNELTQSAPKLEGGHGSEGFFHEYYHAGRNALFVDGAVRFIRQGADRDIWARLLTVNDGGSAVDVDDIPSASLTYGRLKLGNCLRLAIFVLLFFLPLPWVWWNPTSGRGQLVESP